MIFRPITARHVREPLTRVLEHLRGKPEAFQNRTRFDELIKTIRPKREEEDGQEMTHE